MSDYFSNRRTRGSTCGQCSWTGTGQDASHELFAELFKVNCPECDARLDLISFPTNRSIREASERGNPDAQEMLAKRTKDPEADP